MTARSGDALSHLHFQVLQSAVLTEFSARKILRSAQRRVVRHASENSFPSNLHGRHEATSRNGPGRQTSFVHYLPKSFRIGG
jgi:hypothetical protein